METMCNFWAFGADVDSVLLTLVLLCPLILSMLGCLMLTESRYWARQVWQSIMGYSAIVFLLAMVLLFVVHYIPSPLCKGCGNGSPVKHALVVNGDSPQSFYHDCFSDLLTVFSVLGAVFGVIVPVGAYFIQRRSLKDESVNLLKAMHLRESELRKNHTSLRRELRDLRGELDECEEGMTRVSELKELISRNSRESMRTNLYCTLVAYSLPGMSSEDKTRVVKSYLQQFVLLIRLACAFPKQGEFDSDVKRFSDAISLFRKGAVSYNSVLAQLADEMSDESVPSMPELTRSFNQDAIALLRKELSHVVPTMFI